MIVDASRSLAYLGASILFILSLGGLSKQETRAARQSSRHHRHG